MERFTTTIKAATLAVTLLACQAAAQCPGLTNPYSSTTTMTAGYKSTLIANGMTRARGLAFDSEGNLLVLTRETGVQLLKLNDTTGCVASSKTLINDTNINHGIALSADGKLLFVSGWDNVYAYAYDAEAGMATAGKVVINNMRNGGLHYSRTLVVSKFRPDVLMVARGSDGNVDVASTDVSQGRCEIKLYSISEIMKAETPVDMAKGGTVLGSGLRNIVGFAEHPVTGGVWSVENGMDDIRRQDKDVHMNNPAERLNYHGALSDAKNPYFGTDYGYPGCAAAWKPEELLNPALKVGDLFVPNVDANASIEAVDTACAKHKGPRLVFPAHTAPIDIKFNKDGSAAYITFHGSWNRQPPDGYRLMMVEFGADGQPKEPLNSTTAAAPVMANANNGNCPGRCFRPTGLAWDAKGRLFMASDASNQVFMITGA